MNLQAVVAVSKNGVMGVSSRNDLPWEKLPNDMNHFRELTTGHHVVMGRKTWESIPEKYRPLPERTNLVVSRDPGFNPQHDNVKVFRDTESLLAYLGELDDTAFLIGGENLFNQLLPHCNEVHVSRIDAEYEGDVMFPGFKQFGTYQMYKADWIEKDQKNKHHITIMSYEKVA
jgi:dihydrofolate reductase